MPIYEYECIDKKHRFEAMQKMADQPLKKCQVCGGKVKKLISSTAFSLKGGGWYKDGYASTKPTNSAGSSSETKSSETKSSETKKGDQK